MLPETGLVDLLESCFCFVYDSKVNILFISLQVQRKFGADSRAVVPASYPLGTVVMLACTDQKLQKKESKFHKRWPWIGTVKRHSKFNKEYHYLRWINQGPTHGEKNG